MKRLLMLAMFATWLSVAHAQAPIVTSWRGLTVAIHDDRLAACGPWTYTLADQPQLAPLTCVSVTGDDVACLAAVLADCEAKCALSFKCC